MRMLHACVRVCACACVRVRVCACVCVRARYLPAMCDDVNVVLFNELLGVRTRSQEQEPASTAP